MTRDARIAQRTNIELTRQKFHWLISTIPEAALSEPSQDPAWTNGELLMHMCMAPRVMLADLSHVVDGNWIHPPLLILLPKTLRKKLYALHVRSMARTATPLSFIIEFDKTCLFALKLLEERWDQDFEAPLAISDGDALLSGKVRVRNIFDYLPACFEAHSKKLRFLRKKESEGGFLRFIEDPKMGSPGR